PHAGTAPRSPTPPHAGTAPRNAGVPAGWPGGVPPPPPTRNITIDAIAIANPLIVTGRARTFENNVALRVRDARGAVIAETFTTATGEMGTHSPYRGTIFLTHDPGNKITIEALEYSAKDGAEQSLVSFTRPYTVETIAVQLYLPNRDCTGVVAQTRRLPKSVSMARLLVETLMAQRAPFPKGSRVESISLRGGTLTVDFNERLQNVGGACAAQMIRESVTRTLQKLPSVKKVIITAGGSEKLALQP
ncbi:MAG TPA: Gmad2 immunoglobulin-like domain-containing protein, partial [Thermoanaerobaculia bacterium]|nr:Gmad2 immunoglobulin-like domain-containing protein [Thermoanaerobaculia bacterium]